MNLEMVFDKVSDWLREESLSRGLALAGTAVGAVLLTGWRWFRKKPSPERVVVNVDAPPSSRVDVHVGGKEF